MGQLANGLTNEQAKGSKTILVEPPAKVPEETPDAGNLGEQLDRVKRLLWYGDVERALKRIEDNEDGLHLLSKCGESRGSS
jgi:hypothetical protein